MDPDEDMPVFVEEDREGEEGVLIKLPLLLSGSDVLDMLASAAGMLLERVDCWAIVMHQASGGLTDQVPWPCIYNFCPLKL